ncbi:glutamate 5-kinase [Alicyclobacillus hesperidum]|uniref:Glutamate 5-kinase n=1 Tax=Alicyclobacillus hesperidum TaxID=89784 RepID=A0AA37U8M7_9BACL|nr:glutamate 5-kinase [Alicyclobacillus hesperidum]GLV14307.1 glutamate 5-kinase [Alicyclobacillus hesperidum]
MSIGARRRQRAVVKVGSSSLTDGAGVLSVAKMERLVKQIAELQREGCWHIVLVSSGAIAAGLGKLGWQRARISMPEKQAAAAVGQTALMEEYERLFAREGLHVGQLLLTRADVEDRKRFVHIRNTVQALLRHEIIPIINENDTVAVEEIRFGDNDSLAGLAALVSEADKLVLLTDIDGLYTANPRTHPEATRIDEVLEITDEIERLAGGAGSAVGTGGMRTKMTAAKAAVQAGVEVVIASAQTPDVLRRALSGEPVGTRFLPAAQPVSLRKSWLMHAPKPEGALTIDAGAVHALLTGGGSLLVPGIVSVTGDFQEGAVILLQSVKGDPVGKGITSFSARDLDDLLARRRSGEDLHNVHEVVHRNDMVLVMEANAR